MFNTVYSGHSDRTSGKPCFVPHVTFLRLCVQLVNAGEDVLVFYNDRSSFPVLLTMMGSERERTDENGALAYHTTLVELLAACTEGKNVYTELKCNSLLPLDDIVKVVTHVNCIPEVVARQFYWKVITQLYGIDK